MKTLLERGEELKKKMARDCLTWRELADKYKISIASARKIFFKDRGKIRIDTFNVYDSNNPEDPELIRMRNYVLNNPGPEYEEFSWSQPGPCSNWGIDLYRPETNEEWDNRIKDAIKKKGLK